jgi:hypothetical protein
MRPRRIHPAGNRTGRTATTQGNPPDASLHAAATADPATQAAGGVTAWTLLREAEDAARRVGAAEARAVTRDLIACDARNALPGARR